MGRYKYVLIGIQELVWNAIETGARDEDAIFAYVYMHERMATEEIVHDILVEIQNEYDYQLQSA